MGQPLLKPLQALRIGPLPLPAQPNQGRRDLHPMAAPRQAIDPDDLDRLHDRLKLFAPRIRGAF
jgi:hypothetical protein